MVNNDIQNPSDPKLDHLCAQLASLTTALDVEQHWPRDQLRLCAEYGVFKWFIAPEYGGLGWSETDQVRGYLRLSSVCLTTAFILTQWHAAVRRIADSDNVSVKEQLLPGLASGQLFTSVGISHLTTSRRFTGTALRAEVTPTGYFLNGFSPWVTGAPHADFVVLGAQLDNGLQILIVVDTEMDGIVIGEPARLVGLTASHTAELRCEEVDVPRELWLAGPMENVVSASSGSGTGGLQTSTLAIGLTSTAITYLEEQLQQRSDLSEIAQELRKEHVQLRSDLMDLAAGKPVCTNESLRKRANSLVLRSTQAALAAAKGTGYVIGHPAGRWCREALFFLVWSCPHQVVQANMCELAGLE
ncbi:MAG: acyl-CoA dehydrogenase family protein [Planctomycetota bacterium]|nr:acyl-CoA dehydrogenase family protein [Planctomycetota bacterium]